VIIHKPDELSFEQCAAIPETWITAIQALYLIGGFQNGKGERVLWHAGASAVSIAGIQLSKAGGASEIYATARSDDKCEFVVKEFGVTAAFNTTKTDWAEEVLKATSGKGVDIIVDFIGKDTVQGNLTAAGRDARIVQLGTMSGSMSSTGIDIGSILYKRIRWEGSTLRSRSELYQQKLRDLLEENALPKFKDGTFKIVIEKVMNWEDIVEAHQLMESNKTKGKIVMIIP
jgi:NADPH:quinone reductase-like Zn-dependent oxidoreductase